MGAGILACYRQRVKQTWKWAFLSTMVIGLLIHAYRFTNTLLNHDALYNVYSSQNMTDTGAVFCPSPAR